MNIENNERTYLCDNLQYVYLVALRLIHMCPLRMGDGVDMMALINVEV